MRGLLAVARRRHTDEKNHTAILRCGAKESPMLRPGFPVTALARADEVIEWAWILLRCVRSLLAPRVVPLRRTIMAAIGVGRMLIF